MDVSCAQTHTHSQTVSMNMDDAGIAAETDQVLWGFTY